jgi:hypothetical protein
MKFPPTFLSRPFFVSVFLLMSGVVFAGSGPEKPRQLDFSFSVEPNHVVYSYEWSDSFGKFYTTSFSLLKEEVKVGLQEFKSVGPEWEEGVRQTFLKKVQPILDRNNLELEVTPSSSGFSYSLSGPASAEAAVEDLKRSVPKLYELARVEYARKNYYVGEMTGDKFVLRPDYSALVKRYVGVSTPIARALSRGDRDPRALAVRFLDFIQTIPYSREFTNRAEFQTPLGSYTENKGDCDTKSVSLAALLSSVGIPWVIIALPEHMVLGVGISPKLGEQTLRDQGRSYVLVEPAGSGIPFGKLAPESTAAINSGNYFLIR